MKKLLIRQSQFGINFLFGKPQLLSDYKFDTFQERQNIFQKVYFDLYSYGIGLEDPDSNLGYGHLKCKMSGTYVATQNFSFLVENEYGRSVCLKRTFSSWQKFKVLISHVFQINLL